MIKSKNCLLYLLTGLFFYGLFYTHYTHSHPHSWIDLSSELTINKNNQLTALWLHWQFDIYYSAVRLKDIADNNKTQQQNLDAMAADMAKNLKSYGYFSELRIANQAITLDKPTRQLLTITKKEGIERLQLSMYFTINNTPQINNSALSLRIFDPTYYIDMKYQDQSRVIVHKENSTSCQTTIQPPTPSAETIAYAASLDRLQKSPEGLGQHFAETVTVHCSE